MLIFLLKEDDSETNKEDQNHFQRDLQPMVSWSKQVYNAIELELAILS